MPDNHQRAYLTINKQTVAVQAFICSNDAMNHCFQLRVDCATKQPIDCHHGQNTYLSLDNQRFFHGVIMTIKKLGQKNNKHFITLTIASTLSTLQTINNRNRIYQTPTQTITELLTQHQLPCKLLSIKNNQEIPFLAQYQQSDWALLLRLLKRCQATLVNYQIAAGNNLLITDNLADYQQQLHTIIMDYQPFAFAVDKQKVIYSRQVIIKNGLRHYRFSSNHPDLQPGQLLHINSHDNNEFNKTFRIINIEHRFQQTPNANNQQQQSYSNTLTCIPYNQAIDMIDTDHHIHHTLIAKVDVYQKKDRLNSQGEYACRFAYDKKTLSPNIARRQDFNASGDAGMHLPLQQNDEVMIAYVNNDIDQPIIFSQLPGSKQPSPVNNNNAWQYILQTNSGSQLLLDDQLSLFQLRSVNNNWQMKPSGIYLSSNNGDINIYCQQQLTVNSGLDFIQHSQHYQADYHQQCSIISRQGDCSMTAKQSIELSAQQTIHWQSQTAMITTDSTININAKQQSLKAIYCYMNADSVAYTGQSFCYHAQQQLAGNEQIVLKNNRISFSGKTLTINAKRLEIHAETSLA